MVNRAQRVYFFNTGVEKYEFKEVGESTKIGANSLA